MQLIYLYISEYGNFRHAEFNFSPDVRIHFNEDINEIEVWDAQSRLPERFWGENISSLSVVVGNNGAGKTSLMQYIIELFLNAHESRREKVLYEYGTGIMIFGEGDMLYEYCFFPWEQKLISIRAKSCKYQRSCWLKRSDVERILGRTKLIYLTNALARRDCQRGQWYKSHRNAPLYDCSMGNVFVSDIEKDVNQIFRQDDSMALETYLLYEQYKQIKFVFDKRQHQICAELKNNGYPVPVPERLYIDLMLENHLGTELSDDDDDNLWDLDELDDFEVLDEQIFPDLAATLKAAEVEIKAGKHWKDSFVWKQLGRCAIWCAVRSAAKVMNSAEKRKLCKFLKEWKTDSDNYVQIFEQIWDEIVSIKETSKEQNDPWQVLNSCRRCYIDFLHFISSETLGDHFIIEMEQSRERSKNSSPAITLSVSTEDSEWFMEFLEKYRYVCNPDYFLDFYWLLSSGENNLLSLFASLYYIYGADYTNHKNGDYQIWNELRESGPKRCDSVILLIDEADLTYHPEWQRVFIGLLTAFLPRVYPPQCCKEIQVVPSTHSPILLSDVPQQSVIYLKYDPKHRRTEVSGPPDTGTFGQNIHLLFKDSFFLEHGTMGLFAHRKIDELVKNLKQIESALMQGELEQQVQWADQLEQQYRLCAELIAEPIIRRKLLLWIDSLEQKLLQVRPDGRYRQLSDEELELELQRLREELNRRRT